MFSGPGQTIGSPARRHRKVASWPRVTALFGKNVVGEVPVQLIQALPYVLTVVLLAAKVIH